MFEVRPIQNSDNPKIAGIIRTVFEEFKINKPGTAYFDPCLDSLYETYTVSGSAYFIAEMNGMVVGGAGIYPTQGLPQAVCELVKMYILPQSRGFGVGRTLINRCADQARILGYNGIYLETMPELKTAVAMYEKSGFQLLPQAMGQTGHFGCSIHMFKEIGNRWVKA